VATPTRFSQGVTNVAASNPMRMLPIPDPTAVHVWFDDFDNFEADQWIITTTEAGAGSATEAVANADNGILVITNDAADNDNDFFQWSGDDAATAIETFRFTAGKQLWFKARLKIDEVVQSDFVIGLQIIDTSPLAVTDGVYLMKDDGDANLDCYVTKNSTSTTSVAASTLTADTYAVLGFYYNGVDAVEFFKDNTVIARLATTNLPDDEDMTISFGIQNGEAVAKVLSVDYIFVCKER
jgi:hypothetical protein